MEPRRTTNLFGSREHSQPALAFHLSETALEQAPPFPLETTNDYAKFSFDCALYRRTKREMLANGWDEVQIFGRSEIDVDTAILGWIDPQDGQPLPTWASRMANKMLNGAPMPLRLASTFLLTKMMRVCSSKGPTEDGSLTYQSSTLSGLPLST